MSTAKKIFKKNTNIKFSPKPDDIRPLFILSLYLEQSKISMDLPPIKRPLTSVSVDVIQFARIRLFNRAPNQFHQVPRGEGAQGCDCKCGRLWVRFPLNKIFNTFNIFKGY